MGFARTRTSDFGDVRTVPKRAQQMSKHCARCFLSSPPPAVSYTYRLAIQIQRRALLKLSSTWLKLHSYWSFMSLSHQRDKWINNRVVKWEHNFVKKAMHSHERANMINEKFSNSLVIVNFNGHWFGNWSHCCWRERRGGRLNCALHVLVGVFGDADSGSHLLLRAGLQNCAELLLNLLPARCYKLRNGKSS